MVSSGLRYGLPPVRLLRPALWSAAAVGTLYVGCAAYEVHHDIAVARAARQHAGRPADRITMLDVAQARSMIAFGGGRTPPPYVAASHWRDVWPWSGRPAGAGNDDDDDGGGDDDAYGPLPRPVSTAPLTLWARLPEPGKLMFGLVSTNVGVFALERLLPGTSAWFSHLPTAGANYTLLSSAFGHVGLAHLGLNMYGIVQFLPPVAASPTFASSGSHLAAFYLSAGVLASFAYRLATVWPRPLDRVIPARGASGAVMAVVGAFGLSYPDSQLGIVLLPGSLPAAQFLLGLAAFETYGLFIGFKRIPLAHAAHLAGLAVGSAYVYWDGQARVWRPLRRWVFGQMHRLALV